MARASRSTRRRTGNAGSSSFPVQFHDALGRQHQGSTQQSGRGSIAKSILQTLPVLDVNALTPQQLAKAVALFDDMSGKPLLPLHEIDIDLIRKELDEKFARIVLGLAASIFTPGGAFEVLRMKMAQEPSIRGPKA